MCLLIACCKELTLYDFNKMHHVEVKGQPAQTRITIEENKKECFTKFSDNEMQLN